MAATADARPHSGGGSSGSETDNEYEETINSTPEEPPTANIVADLRIEPPSRAASSLHHDTPTAVAATVAVVESDAPLTTPETPRSSVDGERALKRELLSPPPIGDGDEDDRASLLQLEQSFEHINEEAKSDRTPSERPLPPSSAPSLNANSPLPSQSGKRVQVAAGEVRDVVRGVNTRKNAANFQFWRLARLLAQTLNIELPTHDNNETAADEDDDFAAIDADEDAGYVDEQRRCEAAIDTIVENVRRLLERVQKQEARQNAAVAAADAPPPPPKAAKLRSHSPIPLQSVRIVDVDDHLPFWRERAPDLSISSSQVHRSHLARSKAAHSSI